MIVTALLTTFWNDIMAKYIVPAGSDVMATWSAMNHDNLRFKHTTKEAIFDESDTDIDCSRDIRRLVTPLLAFNLPQPRARNMIRIAFKESQVLRKE